MMTPDEGFFFGIGAFETIAVEEGQAILLEEHYERLKGALKFLGISLNETEMKKKVQKTLAAKEMQSGRKVMKITISEHNLIISARDNTYTDEAYIRGFRTDVSKVVRNETSPFTYYKTLNYGDCLREKRLAKLRGIDEPVFLNTKGMISEGACSNVFFVRDGRLYTPSVSCGLLPGIMRAYICQRYEVTEQDIFLTDLPFFQEMFVTNSLLGVMPVVSLGEYIFPSNKIGRYLISDYRKFCREYGRKQY